MSPAEVRDRVRRAIEAEARQYAAHLAELRRHPLPPARIDEPPDGLPLTSTRWPEPAAEGRRLAVEGQRRRRLVEKTAALRLGDRRRSAGRGR